MEKLRSARELWFLPLEEAVTEKYRRGRREHGDVWVGPRPVFCLHDEILDAIVYSRLERQDLSEPETWMREKLLCIEATLVEAKNLLDEVYEYMDAPAGEYDEASLERPFEIPSEGI